MVMRRPGYGQEAVRESNSSKGFLDVGTRPFMLNTCAPWVEPAELYRPVGCRGVGRLVCANSLPEVDLCFKIVSPAGLWT